MLIIYNLVDIFICDSNIPANFQG